MPGIGPDAPGNPEAPETLPGGKLDAAIAAEAPEAGAAAEAASAPDAPAGKGGSSGRGGVSTRVSRWASRGGVCGSRATFTLVV
ncbi:hypothetical protein BG58_14795 [Caballeronia jiangsuensis]|nr:hypothetical protein BG58_14795 [Caballeronia jiangsuensis]